MVTPPVGAYLIEAALGASDSPHEVFRARGPSGRHCVLKRLRPHCRGREDLESRLEHEASILRILGGTHHVIRLLDLAGPPLCLVLEFAGGGSLADRLNGAPLPAAAAGSLAGQLLDAVAHAHAHGVLHRDLKPSNLLFAGRELKLIDFGVAASGSPARGLPEGWVEEAIGTVPYSAPEQMETPDTGCTPASDLFSAGVILYEMLTGALPYEPEPGEGREAFARRMRAEGPRPLRVPSPEIEPSIERVVLGAVDPSPARRPGSAEELRRLLRQAGLS